ncbi:GntR family transcriptional regulator [Jiella avicenniae]|uniref:GntR family transcriptional regulator n=1 Tax=Jiella avicenniae TaxID=2907202 RepID=A0A9X1T5B9_9HYPH|nr:GntR family transcriptional regulator [Jiella avicenniae]MCE7029471.1 GntR family transcriptional regulator [Jiella avicenniae]
MTASQETAASAVERAYRALKAQILSNELQAGRPISDQKIGEQLGMSRTPVREALQLLQYEGYVVISPRRGVHVVPIGLDEMTRTYEMITALELYSLRLCGLRGPAGGAVEAMQAACARMAETLETDLNAWSSADLDFHRALLRAGGNELILNQGMHHWERVSRAHRVAMRLRAAPVLSTEAHADVARLVASGETEEAVRRHCSQRERSGKELTEAVAAVGLTEL